MPTTINSAPKNTTPPPFARSVSSFMLSAGFSKSESSIKTVKSQLQEELYLEMKQHMKKSDFMSELSDVQLESIIVKTWLHAHGIAAFLDRSLTKEENLKNAAVMLKDSIYATAFAIQNNYPKVGL